MSSFQTACESRPDDPRGVKLGDSQWVCWYFKFCSPSLIHLLLFTFHCPPIAAPCILSDTYCCIQWERHVEVCLVHLAQNKNPNIHFVSNAINSKETLSSTTDTTSNTNSQDCLHIAPNSCVLPAGPGLLATSGFGWGTCCPNRALLRLGYSKQPRLLRAGSCLQLPSFPQTVQVLSRLACLRASWAMTETSGRKWQLECLAETFRHDLIRNRKMLKILKEQRHVIVIMKIITANIIKPLLCAIPYAIFLYTLLHIYYYIQSSQQVMG